jgi:hypothetical protein
MNTPTKYSTATLTEFYQIVGKLCYGVAFIDQTINFQETAKLKALVRDKWIHLENGTDRYGTDLAYQIEIVFDWLVENNWDISQTIPDLKLFIKEHSTLFTKEVKQLILSTVYAIAAAFSGYNKSELVFASKIEEILAA